MNLHLLQPESYVTALNIIQTKRRVAHSYDLSIILTLLSIIFFRISFTFLAQTNMSYDDDNFTQGGVPQVRGRPAGCL